MNSGRLVFAQILIRKARRLYTQDANGLDIDELVFKWIKQNLRIKAFYGTSENAVRTQIWIAICVYLMVACLNKIQGINESLSRIMQILSVNVFQKEPVYQLLKKYDTRDARNGISKQLVLNGF